jgi:hypothetical protein
VPENFAPGLGRRGRVSLAESFERAQLAALTAELEAAKRAASEPEWERLLW